MCAATLCYHTVNSFYPGAQYHLKYCLHHDPVTPQSSATIHLWRLLEMWLLAHQPAVHAVSVAAAI
jgi:hypothetical protein